MRLDKALIKLNLSQNQWFFATCWYNMIHRYSLDSHRVKAMNPINSLRELKRMMSSHANNNDFVLVGEETLEILKNDPTLDLKTFAETKNTLNDLIVEVLPRKSEDKFKLNKTQETLIHLYSNDLLNILKESYVEELLELLRIKIDSENEQQQDIKKLTGNLLSLLLDQGANLESLFAFYSEIIRKTNPTKTYDFNKRFKVLTTLITKPVEEFQVIFPIDHISNVKDFPVQIGTVKFEQAFPLPHLKLSAHPKKIAQLMTSNVTRIFASVSVKTKDERSAGTEAYTLINNILDLVRFEYERSSLHVSEQFLVINNQTIARCFNISKIVPNPNSTIDNDGLENFVKSVRELIENRDLREEDRRRIQSAFRLYRIGSDSNIFENKLINWWTAIEYLTKGNSNTIGTAVENSLAPILCLGYLNKLLLSYRNAFIEMRIEIENKTAENTTTFKEINAVQVFEILKDKEKSQAILDRIKDPYFNWMLKNFINSLSSPKAISNLLTEHENRLRRHIQRIYRARCDIVHSAERIVSAALLCANLEFYLKSTLNALLTTIRTAPSILGPNDFFERETYVYKRLLDDLNKNSEIKLYKLLNS